MIPQNTLKKQHNGGSGHIFSSPFPFLSSPDSPASTIIDVTTKTVQDMVNLLIKHSPCHLESTEQVLTWRIVKLKEENNGS